MNTNNYYNKNLQPFSNKLRHNMTKAESCLWNNIHFVTGIIQDKIEELKKIHPLNPPPAGEIDLQITPPARESSKFKQ